MKWITSERARVDRIACPWLISRFIDPQPEFIFVPAKEVASEAKKRGAIPYDIPNVDLGHHGPECSFDAFVDRYELTDPALRALAVIVRGADTDDRDLTPESSGLYAAATGFQATSKDDFDNMARQFPMYDAFYNYCQQQGAATPKTPRVLFVCLHGAAKSVVAAAHVRKLAAQRGLAVEAQDHLRVQGQLAVEHLDRDAAAAGQPRPVDARHAALAEHALDGVAAGQDRADQRIERGRNPARDTITQDG